MLAYEHIVIQIKNIIDIAYFNVVAKRIQKTTKNNLHNFVW